MSPAPWITCINPLATMQMARKGGGGGEVGETKELYRLPQTSTPSTNTCSLLVRLLIKIQFKNKHYFELNTKMLSIWSNIVNYLLLEG